MHHMGNQVAQRERTTIARIAWRGDREIFEERSAPADPFTLDGEHESNIATAES
jgi:hypothetical protein